MPLAAVAALGATALPVGAGVIGGSTLLTTGALAAGGFTVAGGFKKTGINLPKLPGVEDVPRLTIEEIESQERGWEEILSRAQGRRGTILTDPQLAQITPFTQRATLLAG